MNTSKNHGNKSSQKSKKKFVEAKCILSGPKKYFWSQNEQISLPKKFFEVKMDSSKSQEKIVSDKWTLQSL